MSQSILEFKVLAFILNRKHFLKYKDVVKLEFFRSRELKLIYKTILKLHEKIKKPVVRVKDIWLLLEKRVDPEETLRYKKILIRMKVQYRTLMKDEDVLHLTITRFAQENLLREVLTSRVQELESGVDVDLDDFKTKVDRILQLNGTRKVVDYNYADSHLDRISKKQEPYRLATGIAQELDGAISGGVAGGELAFFLAPTGRGKTLALANVGANALKQGKKVFHVTLEISARAVGKRYDCILAESSYEDIREEPEVLNKVLEKLIEVGGQLVIKDYSYTHCGVSELNAIIQEHWDENKKFDLLIVDYADLLLSQSANISRFDLDMIYKELRIIAGQFGIPVWTASQANRIALSKHTISMSEIAESIGKANVADLIIAMCQTDEEIADKEMRLFICKNRLGPHKPIITVMCDPGRMLLRSMSSSEMENQWIKPRLGKIRKQVSGGGNVAKKGTTKG